MIRIFSVLAIAFFISCAQKESKQPIQQDSSTVTKPARERSGESIMVEARKQLTLAKERLKEEGKYFCCVKDPCNYCALHESSCDCYKDLQAGEHVCVECYSEWQRGNGAVENLKKEAVKTDFLKHEHKPH